MTQDVKQMTAEELVRLPEDGNRYELVAGELVPMSPSFGRHSMIAGRIAAHLGHHVRANRLGEVLVADGGFILRRSPDTVRCPDVSFVRNGRPIEDAFVNGAPDLAVEVVSSGDTYSEIESKVRDYLSAGCPMVAVVDPRKSSVSVHTASNVSYLSAGDALHGGDVVPGWKLPLAEIFG